MRWDPKRSSLIPEPVQRTTPLCWLKSSPSIGVPRPCLGTQMLNAFPLEGTTAWGAPGSRLGTGLDHSTGFKPHPSSHCCKLQDVSSFCMPRTSAATLLSLAHSDPFKPGPGGHREDKACFLPKPGLATPSPAAGTVGDSSTPHRVPSPWAL